VEVIAEIKTGNAHIKKLSNGIVLFRHLDGVKNLKMNDFVENYNGILSLQKSSISPLLGNVTNIEKVGNDAKAFMTKVLPNVSNALAFVNENTNSVTTFTINTYLYLHRPQVPTKIFSSEKKAFEWLLEFA
jgi:hypothetical protein